jgi:hypothetical protein
MARLLRVMPELMVILKGMVAAMRSVFFTFCILGCIMYVFAIAFVQLMDGTDSGGELFPDIPKALNTLLVDMIFPDQGGLIEAVGSDGWFYKLLLLAYIFLASLTVLNMLIGVLCEVVGAVSTVEKEVLLINYVKGVLLEMLESSGLDANGNHLISRQEFEAMLEIREVAGALQEIGVDVIGLIDLTDYIFKEKDQQLTFPDFMEIMLQLRGTNTATVKDLVDFRKVMTSDHHRLEESLSKLHFSFEQVFQDRLSQHPLSDNGTQSITTQSGIDSATLS